MRSKTTFNIVSCALMSAVICVLSQISFPLPTDIPLTLQTFAVALCGYFLGMKYGTVSVIVFLALGALGVPVFSGFRGGIHMLTAGLTGGFLWGFIFLALFCGLGVHRMLKKHGGLFPVLFGVLGLLLCHFCGVSQYSAISGVGFITSLLSMSLPFLIKDILSVIAAYFCARAISKALRR